MAVNRINWTSASQGQRVVPCVLIAGLPYAIVPAGVSIASVTWTGDADGAWHVGTSPTVKAWLDTGREAPPLVIEEHASPIQGTLDVKDVTLNLLDVAGEVTRVLSSRRTPYALLAANLTAAGTTITVDAPALFSGGGGTVHIGRERITYAGVSGSTLTSCTRGTAGTRASLYVGDERHRVYAQPSGADILPSTIDRRITVWALRITDAGAATDPTLLYDGRGTIGARLTRDGAAWEIPTKHVSKVLAEKASAPSVLGYGYAHTADPDGLRSASTTNVSSSDTNPLVVWWLPSGGAGACVLLTNATAAPDSGGWHPTRESFLADWNRAANALSVAVRAAIGPDGRLRVAANASPDRRLSGKIAWTRRQVHYDPQNPNDTVGTAQIGGDADAPMPAACFWLQGPVTLPPSDIAQIPAVPSNPLTDSVDAFWTLTGLRDNGIYEKTEITGRITAVGATTVSVTAPSEVNALGAAGYLFTRPTTFRVGLEARGARWWTTLRYGVFDQLDALRGLDWLSDSIAWTRIATLATANPGFGSAARVYYLDARAPILDTILNEARLMGAALVTYRGRVSVGVFREVSPTDPRVATIETANLRASELAEGVTCPDGILTSMKITIAETGDVIRVNDGGAVKESGNGEEIELTAPRGCLPPTPPGSVDALAGTISTFARLAMEVISPWSRPYDVVTLPVTLAFAHLELGDVIGVEEWMLPNADGTRGLESPDVAGAALPGLVIGRKINLTSGEVDLDVRVTQGSVYGYAPEAIVASISGAVLTLSTTVPGAAGFASEYLADGTARTDGGASTFTAGDKVQLLEIDATSPATPFDGEVASVSGATVTLTASPGATWEGIAAAGRCMVVFDVWADAATAQKLWAFIADDSTVALSDGTTARRYA